jgi:predicted nuclease of predicted toxin-antitoxin system
MKIVIDMNLPPSWVEVLQAGGHDAVHWSQIGLPRASDQEILLWSRQNGFVVFTHDLDFGAILAATGASSPSVIQVRSQDVTPQGMGKRLLAALSQFTRELEQGSLISVDDASERVRILPIA